MPAVNISYQVKDLPVQLVGGTNFGRYAKISDEETVNMIVSGDWLVPYAGYKEVADIGSGNNGRGVFNSTNLGSAIMVIDGGVYLFGTGLTLNLVGTLDTVTGDVFIAENNAKQIAICDRKNLYIFDWGSNTFSKVPLDWVPIYITFQGTYFIAAEKDQAQWRLSEQNNGLLWPSSTQFVGGFETKPDHVLAVFPFPGKENVLLVMGKTVTELWTLVGGQLFPYQRSSYINLDYGCVNPATIAFSDTFIVWLGVNEKSGITLLMSTGNTVNQISNDGLDFLFSQLCEPENCYGFLFKQDGHLIYQFTFPGDNLSFAYDFNTKMFFTVTDEKLNYHIAKNIIYFNNDYYFLSFNDGKVYEMNSRNEDLNNIEQPRIRKTVSFRTPDAKAFVAKNFSFTMEMGDSPFEQRVDLSLSKDGGEVFGNKVGHKVQPLGRRQNKIDFWNMGRANELVLQLQFWGRGRILVWNGVLRIFI